MNFTDKEEGKIMVDGLRANFITNFSLTRFQIR